MADDKDHVAPPAGVGATSLGVARLRADESRRSDRLFNDPYAHHFIQAGGPSAALWTMPSPQQSPDFFALMADQVAVRTRFFDDALLEAAGKGTTQVVLLACGMDTRAFRLRWPAGVRVFEVDLPDTLAFKDAVLTEQGAIPRCQRIEVNTDLRTDWPAALTDAGWQAELPTIWLAEGILYALPPEAADLLLDRITTLSAPGSTMVFDHNEDSHLLRTARAAISPELVDLWRGGPAEEPGTWLSQRGWQPTVHDVGDIIAQYGRPAPLAFQPGRDDAGRGWLVTARLSMPSSPATR